VPSGPMYPPPPRSWKSTPVSRLVRKIDDATELAHAIGFAVAGASDIRSYCHPTSALRVTTIGLPSAELITACRLPSSSKLMPSALPVSSLVISPGSTPGGSTS